jgi:hypothetical protein
VVLTLTTVGSFNSFAAASGARVEGTYTPVTCSDGLEAGSPTSTESKNLKSKDLSVLTD